MSAGVGTANLPALSDVLEVLGHQDTGGGLRRTGRIPLGILATALSAASIAVWTPTEAVLQQRLNYGQDTGGIVLNDPDETRNGIYTKSGASGTGSWVRRRGLLFGPAGASVELRSSDGFVQWRLVGASAWLNLVPLSAITGPPGATGAGTEMRLSGGFVQWRPIGASAWTNLFAMADLIGATGNSVELRNSGGFIQWRPAIATASWINIVATADLVGATGASTELRTSAGVIQWRPVGSPNWTDLIQLSALTGAAGAAPELRVSGGMIQWRLVGSTIWNDLIPLSAITGATGASVEMRVSGGVVQWRVVGSTIWNDLVTLAAITGPAPEMRTNAGMIQWRPVGSPNWTDLIALAAITGAPGLNGAPGVDGLPGADGRSVQMRVFAGVFQWRLEGDERWLDLTDLSAYAQLSDLARETQTIARQRADDLAEQRSADAALRRDLEGATASLGGTIDRTTVLRLLAMRPGDTPEHYSLAGLAGPATGLAPASVAIATDSEFGRVASLSAAGILARRECWAIEEGRPRQLRTVLRRRVNSTDPANDALQFGVAWLDRYKQQLPGAAGRTILKEWLTLQVENGRQAVGYTIGKDAGSGQITPPAGAVYGREYVQTFGSTPTTDIEVLGNSDLGDAALVSSLTQNALDQIAGLVSLQIANRLSSIEASLGTPARKRVYATATDAAAANVPGYVDTIETYSPTPTGNSLAGLYRRISGSPISADAFKTQDGQQWEKYRPAGIRLTLFHFGARDDGTDCTAALTNAAKASSDYGIEILVPKGVAPFAINGTVTIASNARLVGEGRPKFDCRRLADGKPKTDVVLQINGSRNLVRGLGFQTTCLGTTFQFSIGPNTAADQLNGDLSKAAFDNWIDDCLFEDVNSGIRFVGPNTRLTRLRFLCLAGAAIRPTGEWATGFEIEAIQIINGLGAGIFLTTVNNTSDGSPSNYTIRNAHKWCDLSLYSEAYYARGRLQLANNPTFLAMFEAGRAGGDIFTQTAFVRGGVYIDVSCSDMRDGGSTVQGSDHLIIGAEFYNGMAGGMYINGDNITVIGFTAWNCKYGLGFGVAFGNLCRNNKVFGPDIQQCWEVGVKIEGQGVRAYVPNLSDIKDDPDYAGYNNGVTYNLYRFLPIAGGDTVATGPVPPTHTAGTVPDGVPTTDAQGNVTYVGAKNNMKWLNGMPAEELQGAAAAFPTRNSIIGGVIKNNALGNVRGDGPAVVKLIDVDVGAGMQVNSRSLQHERLQPLEGMSTRLIAIATDANPAVFTFDKNPPVYAVTLTGVQESNGQIKHYTVASSVPALTGAAASAVDPVMALTFPNNSGSDPNWGGNADSCTFNDGTGLGRMTLFQADGTFFPEYKPARPDPSDATKTLPAQGIAPGATVRVIRRTGLASDIVTPGRPTNRNGFALIPSTNYPPNGLSIVDNNALRTCVCKVSARDETNTDHKSWRLSFTIARGGTASAVYVIPSSIKKELISQTAGAGKWDVDVIANAATQPLPINCQPLLIPNENGRIVTGIMDVEVL